MLTTDIYTVVLHFDHLFSPDRFLQLYLFVRQESHVFLEHNALVRSEYLNQLQVLKYGQNGYTASYLRWLFVGGYSNN